MHILNNSEMTEDGDESDIHVEMKYMTVDPRALSESGLTNSLL